MEAILGRKLTRNEVVHHKNENKLDNRPENLELMSRKEHSRLHADETMRQAMSLRWRGENANAAKLTEAIVRQIKSSPLSGREWARRLNLCPSTIHEIRRGNSWKHVQ